MITRETIQQNLSRAAQEVALLSRTDVQNILIQNPDAGYYFSGLWEYDPNPALILTVIIDAADSDISGIATDADSDGYIYRCSDDWSIPGLRIERVIEVKQAYTEEERQTLRDIGKLQAPAAPPSWVMRETLVCH